MKTRAFILLIALLFSYQIFAQEVERKDLNAHRINEPIKIDGILDETAYQKAELATDFVQLMPHNGKPTREKTEVKVLYDDDAIYVGAMLYDNPDSIASYITTRDNIGASDYFLLALDPNNEGLLMYEFLVTPANSQSDLKGSRVSNFDNEDISWNAVWESATSIQDNGWSVEIKIPYSAIRFAEEENPVWGVNFLRRIRRYNSNNSWNFINAKISGWLHQSGQLHGLSNIKPPVRLSITPYIAQYAERNSADGENDFYFRGGLDLKYGVSESHTIDMMLIPDFGQIQSDDEELNLTPYEVYYDEKRQFFNEGSEMFSKADVFYSRRIGARPMFSDDASEDLSDNEELSYNPSKTQLVNATKFSGKDKNGFGIGVLNAMTLPAKAEITNTSTGEVREVLTQPFTNYNVTVLEKSMKNSSYVSIINTNLSMVDNPYTANVTATQFLLKNKKQTYQLSGVLGGSYKSQSDVKTGYGYGINLDKIKGNTRFSAVRNVFSDDLDVNDLGYMRRNNIMEHAAELSYHIFEPFSIFKNWSAEIEFENTRLYNPGSHISNQMDLGSDATFKNNMYLALSGAYNFGEYDFFEPRSSNQRYYYLPEHFMLESRFYTDQNKKLTFNLFSGFYNLEEKGRWGNWIGPGLWFKASPRFSILYETFINNELQAEGYVDLIADDEIYFGTYDRNTLENTISMNYTFNTKVSVDLRARHYWSVADYTDDFWFLNEDGSLSHAPNFSTDADISFNAFNIDMIFKWEFAPGSELSVAWKNAIYHEDENVGLSLSENVQNLFHADKINNISAKLLYYIDYNSLTKNKR